MPDACSARLDLALWEDPEVPAEPDALATAQVEARVARLVRQLSAVGTAREKGAISASNAEPPAVTIW